MNTPAHALTLLRGGGGGGCGRGETRGGKMERDRVGREIKEGGEDMGRRDVGRYLFFLVVVVYI